MTRAYINQTALRYYRNLEMRGKPSYTLYVQCQGEWKLACMVNRMLNRF